MGDRSKFQGAAKQNFDIVNKLQINIIELQDVSLALETVKRSDAIIDAIFGTGLDREVKGKYEGVIKMIDVCQKTGNVQGAIKNAYETAKKIIT